MTSTRAQVLNSEAVQERQHHERSLERRLTIYFEDDAVCARAQQNLRQLLASATRADHDAADMTAVLAKRALQYRGVYARIPTGDALSPEFDASTCLGIEWRKTTNLARHCLSRS